MEKPVQELLEYLPHRSPMIWVETVKEAAKNEKGIFGTCSVSLKPDALFVDSNGQIRGSAAIEFVAQAYGFIRAAYQVANNIDNTPKNTYLTGVRGARVDFSGINVKEHKELQVRVQLTRSMHPIYYVRGEVFAEGIDGSVAEVDVLVYAE